MLKFDKAPANTGGKVLDKDLVKVTPDGRTIVIARKGEVLNAEQMAHLKAVHKLTGENTALIDLPAPEKSTLEETVEKLTGKADSETESEDAKAKKPAGNKAKEPSENK